MLASHIHRKTVQDRKRNGAGPQDDEGQTLLQAQGLNNQAFTQGLCGHQIATDTPTMPLLPLQGRGQLLFPDQAGFQQYFAQSFGQHRLPDKGLSLLTKTIPHASLQTKH